MKFIFLFFQKKRPCSRQIGKYFSSSSGRKISKRMMSKHEGEHSAYLLWYRAQLGWLHLGEFQYANILWQKNPVTWVTKLKLNLQTGFQYFRPLLTLTHSIPFETIKDYFYWNSSSVRSSWNIQSPEPIPQQLGLWTEKIEEYKNRFLILKDGIV